MVVTPNQSNTSEARNRKQNALALTDTVYMTDLPVAINELLPNKRNDLILRTFSMDALYYQMLQIAGSVNCCMLNQDGIKH